MTMVVVYPSKKELKASLGQRLRYIETSLFGPEYRDNGTNNKREVYQHETAIPLVPPHLPHTHHICVTSLLCNISVVVFNH